ncbi:40S ribosomal protein S27 [Myotis davidii]|uniref:40S ribosomal protein S27 n=1 Tax=Myotis davidii TaxID=225400 RepID=L5MF07_MYODS|nr:40S ribosomal protein S27 [Myotis davidii]
MLLAKDLLRPPPEEKRKHKRKNLVQSPDSYLMDVKCPGCYRITTMFSQLHEQQFCVLVAPLFSVSQQEEKQGLQKDAPSEGSNTKSTSNQDE